jgi:4,5-DOPA dioxygenase extradiol
MDRRTALQLMLAAGAGVTGCRRPASKHAKVANVQSTSQQKMPVLFVAHGSPMLLDDAGWVRELGAWAGALPRPKAVLMLSAHWVDRTVTLGAATRAVPLVYDFYVFPAKYYQQTYPAPPAPTLAARVKQLLHADPVADDPARGLDHGAYVPLVAMYPDADVPVLQLSMPTHDATKLLALGHRLRALREHGVLVIGSGFMTHGLPFLTREMFTGTVVPEWSRDFDAWAADALSRGDVDELARFRSTAPGMPYAHPTVEHFTPLFVTLGAATDPEAPVATAINGYAMGLSKRSFQAA